MSKNEKDWVRTGQGQDGVSQEQWFEQSKPKNAMSGLRLTGCARAAALRENVVW